MLLLCWSGRTISLPDISDRNSSPGCLCFYYLPLPHLWVLGYGFWLQRAISRCTLYYPLLNPNYGFLPTPVIYPERRGATVPGVSLLGLNPMTGVVEGFLLGAFGNLVHLEAHPHSVHGCCPPAVFQGWIYFKLMEKTFADRVLRMDGRRATPDRRRESGRQMSYKFQRLEVYHLALDYVDKVYGIVQKFTCLRAIQFTEPVRTSSNFYCTEHCRRVNGTEQRRTEPFSWAGTEILSGDSSLLGYHKKHAIELVAHMPQ